LGTEERSLAAWAELRAADVVSSTELIEVDDHPSRFKEITERRIESRRNEFAALGGDTGDLFECGLTAPYDDLIKPVARCESSGARSVVLDVSSLPKRFFFPIIKMILQSTVIDDFMITCTMPASYTQEKLTYNCDDWAHIPSFSGTHKYTNTEMIVVNVGFSPMGLQEEIEHGEPGMPIKLLFPFPAPSEAVRRSWRFVQQLRKHRLAGSFQTYRTDAHDVSDAFDRLLSLTNGGKKQAVLAPFGPKPISVAMCIYATLSGAEVFYSQPTVYHPDYSTGVSERGGQKEIYAYWVRLRGRDLYTLG